MDPDAAVPVPEALISASAARNALDVNVAGPFRE
jgi:hypothetical protein